MDVLSGTLAFNGGTGVSSGTFNAAAGTTNSFNGDYTFNSTSFTGSRNVVLAGGTLTFDGTFNFQNLQQTGGTLAGSNVFSGVFHWSGGNWNSVGATTIASNSVLNIVSGSDHDLANRALTNYGTVVWSGGRVRGGGNPGTPIYNFGLWDAQSDQEINADYGGFGVTFNNAGTFRKSAGTNTTTIQSGVVFTDTGTVDVQSGALVLNNGGTFSSSSLISGGGSVWLASGAFTLNGIITSPNVQEVGGTLVGTNVINGVLNWTNGTWNGASSVTIASNGALNILSAFDHDLPNCALTNYGTVVWSDGRVRGGGNPGTPIYNFGLWDAKSDQEINADYGGFGVTFNNAGTFRKSAGTGATSLLGGVTFDNQSGAIEVDSGRLSAGNNTYFQGGGLFTMKLGGLGAGQSGEFITSSSASLGGPFSVSLADGFVPALGNEFQILACASRSNTFTTLQMPTGISVNYSNNGVFLVITGAVSTLAITAQPTNQTVFAGGTAMFTVSATGTPPLTYRWQKDGTNLTDGGNIFGSATSALTISNVSAANVGTYAVTITNAAGSTLTSRNAALSLLSCLPPPLGMVSWWPGDGNANDIIGGNNGILTNGTTFAAGEVGQAFQLDGVNDFVLVPDSPSLRLSNLTLDGWFNFTALGGLRCLICKPLGTAALDSYALWLQSGVLHGGVNGDSFIGAPLDTTFAPLAGVWYHIAYTFDDAANLQAIYVDGSLIASNTTTLSPAYDTSPVVIGGDLNFQSFAFFFAGRIDEVEIFNRALSAAEIQAIYNAGSSGKCKPSGCLLTCPANIVVTNVVDQCGVMVNYPAPAASGNCSPVSCNPTNGSFFPVGMTTVNCSTTNGASCSFTVTVLDKQNPTITCPTNLVLSTSPGLCSRTNVTYTVTIDDKCPGATLVQTTGLPSGSTFPKGTTTNSFVVTDASGNTASCSFTVTINDTQPPTIACSTNIVANAAAGQTSLIVNFAAPTVSDNCPGVTTNCVPPSGSAFPLGATPVTCTATNGAGNTTTCAFTVTVNSTTTNTPPTITCPSNITTNTLPGTCARTLALAPTATGNPTPTVTFKIASTVISSPYSFPIGTNAVTCTASNVAGTASCSFSVTVNDTEPPVLMCPTNITVQCDANVPAPNPALVKATDNCDPTPVVTHVSDVAAGTCPKIITRTYQASDVAGNSATCAQTITVHDTIAPVISGCSDVTVAAPSGQLGATVNFAGTATDNCDGTVPVTCTPKAGYFALGQTPVTCEAMDHCGNRSTCSFTVIVTARTDPLRLCSFTQGFYGNANGKFNGNTSFTLVGQLLGQGPLVVGKVGARSLSILPGDAALLQQQLPAGGPPAALPDNGDQTLQTAGLPLNSKGRFADVFLGQTITLSLNVRFSSPLPSFPLTPSFCTQGTLAGADGLKATTNDVLVAGDIQMFSIPASVLTALASLGLSPTVEGLLELANRALAGQPRGGATLSDINAAVDAINRGFDECRAPVVNCSTSTVLPDSFNDSFTNRPTLGSGGPASPSLQGPIRPHPSPDPSLNIRVRSSNLAAIKEPGEPDIAGNPGGKSVWWQWQAPRTGPVKITTAGSSFDTLLGVYTGTAISNLVLVASNDDASGTLTSEVAFQAQAGTNYQIAVDAADAASGEIVLTLIVDPPQLCLPVTVVGEQVQFCIDGELGRTYTVEASPDLVNWTLLATALNNDGTLRFTDPAMSNFPQRYYRVTFEP